MSPTDATGASMRRPTQPVIERPETPPRVRDKLAEGERFFRELQGEHKALRARTDEALEAMKESIRDLKAALTESRQERRDRDGQVARELNDMDSRLDQLAEGQIAQAAELRALREAQARQGEQIAQVVEGQRVQGQQLAQVLDALRRREAVEADRASGGLATLPALSPVTSGGQARRAVAVGGGGLSLATLLGLLASLATLPVVVQWALGAVAVVAGLGAVAVAVRWGWRAAGR